jgi:tetratricopeptide (TPR) repeat protein
LTALGDIILSIIPGAGAVGPAKSGIVAAFEITKLLREDVADHEFLSMQALSQRISKGVVDTIIADLELLFGAGEVAHNVPAVFLVDDGHFSRTDPAIVDFFGKLVDKAWSKKWPVLIVVTHWEREWNLAVEGGIESIASAAHQRARQWLPKWEPLRVGPAIDLTSMLVSEFPGLKKAQVQAILNRAAGVPAHLELMMQLCSMRPHYFQGRDKSKRLTDAGLAELLAESVDRNNLIEKRLSDATTPDLVRQAVALSSLQGMRFSCELSEGIAQGIGLDGIAQGLSLAETPHSYVSGASSPVGEFKTRAVQEVARRLLPHVVDEHAALSVSTSLLRQFIEDRVGFLRRAQPEREILAFAAATALEESSDPDDRELARRALGELAFVYLERGNLEDATRTYERLLQTEPSLSWVLGSEWRDRFRTLEFLSSAYRKLGWPSKLSSAYKKMIHLAYHQLNDDGRMRTFVFSRSPEEVRQTYESWMREHLPKIVAEVRSLPDGAGEPIPEGFVAGQLRAAYLASAKALVVGSLGLAELAKEWSDLEFADGDDPVSDAPFMIKNLKADSDGNITGDIEDPSSDSTHSFLRERAYNLGTVISENFAQEQHYELLADDIARTHLGAGRFEKAIEYLERARALAAEMKDPILEIQALQNIGMVYGQKGDRAEGERILIDEAGKRINNLNASGTFLVAAIRHGDEVHHIRFDAANPPDEAIFLRRLDLPNTLSQLFDESPELAVGKFWKLVRMVGDIYGNLGMSALESGNLEKAEERFKSAMENYFDLNDGPNIGQTWMNLAEVARRRGDMKLRGEHLNRALGVYQKLLMVDEGKANAILWANRVAEVEKLLAKEDVV